MGSIIEYNISRHDMTFSLREQQRTATKFLRQKKLDLSGAAAAVNDTAARKLATRTKQEIRRKFKKGPQGNSGFFNAVAVKSLPAKGALGPASFVRLGVPFMRLFQEGGTVKGRSNLIILLPQGAQIGFRRITSGNQWAAVWAKIKSRAVIFKRSDGTVISLKKDGALIPIYKIQKQVTVAKRLSFFELAKSIADDRAEEIVRLLNG